MSKYVLVLKGSPRTQGTSAVLADQVAAGAVAAGAQVDSIYLHGMDIRPCDACDLCREQAEGCVIDDDMQLLYPKLQQADAIVIASPIYWFSLAAQMKLCMDRWYALATSKSGLLAGKKIGIVLAYGDSDPYTSGAINAIRTCQDIFRYTRSEIIDILYSATLSAGDTQNQSELMERAYNLGQKLGA